MKNDACPNCGYCPHCGRSNRPYGTWPFTPYPWSVPTVWTTPIVPQTGTFTLDTVTSTNPLPYTVTVN